MTTPVRQAIGLVIAVITIPFLAIGLVDPLEGGVALIVAGALILVTRLVSRLPVPRVEWIAWTATVVVGMVTIAVAYVMWRDGTTGPGRDMPWGLGLLLVLYEVGVAATIIGGVIYVVRHVKALREAASNA